MIEIIQQFINRLFPHPSEKGKGKEWRLVDDMRVRAEWADKQGRYYIEVSVDEYINLLTADELLSRVPPFFRGGLEPRSIFGKEIRINRELD